MKMVPTEAVETHCNEADEEEGGGGEEEEYEYEEIEVEEEIIEEIEVEVDEDEDDDEIGEPLTPINQENHQNDDSPSKGPKESEESMESGSPVPGEFVANAPDDSVLEGYEGNPKTSGSSESSKQEESSGSRTLIVHNGKDSAGDSGVKNAENMEHSGGEMISAVGVNASNQSANGVQYIEEQTGRIAAENAVDIRKRLDPLDIRQRSSSPELNDANKRAAIICKFFAKGWCIKGKSCRFLHIRDKVADTSQLKEIPTDTSKQKSEPPVDEASSVAQNSAWDDGERAKWKGGAGGLSSRKNDPGSSNSLEHFGQDGLGRRSHVDYNGHCAPQLVKDSSRAYCNGSSREAFSGSPHVSSHCLKRSPLSFSSTSWNADPIRIQNHLDSGPEFRASISSSFLRKSSPFPGSESRYLSRTNISGDKLQLAEYKTNLSVGNWEPSVPFRPSYLITQRLLSKENPYDPVRDSIEQTNSGDGLSQFSLGGQGASKDSTKLQEKAKMESAGTLCSEDSSSRNFIFSHRFHDSGPAKSFSEKDLSATASEVVETAVAEQQSKNSLPKEEKSSNSTPVRDLTEAEKIDVDSESRFQREKPKLVTEPKIDRPRQNNDADVGPKTDGYAQDSKALRHFHAALVEHVKELIRPTWNEGLLSRDAHKLIVKKAVDKVLSTLQPHQIPNSSESVEQYLLASHAKLAKLAEAYIDKYGKT